MQGPGLAAGALSKVAGQSSDLVLGDSSYANRTYQYSRSDQLVMETVFFKEGGTATVVRRYEYNRRGQRTKATDSVYAAGVVAAEKVGEIAYFYNSATARLDSLVGGTMVSGSKTNYGIVRYSYDLGGRDTLHSVTPVGTAGFRINTKTKYDSLSRVISINTSNSTGTVHYTLGPAGILPIYDAVGNVKDYTSTEPGITTGAHHFGYANDGTGRLTNDQAGALSHSWTYDVRGNRLTQSATATQGTSPCAFMTYTYDADNRQLRGIPDSPGGPCSVGRTWTDQAGNRLGESDTTVSNAPGSPPMNGLQSLMTYTAASQLYFSATPTGDVGHYDVNWHWYDAEGRRVISQLGTVSFLLPYPGPNSVGGFRTYYIYDGNDVALELVRSGATWSVDRRMLSGGLDQPMTGRFKILGSYSNVALIADRAGTIIKAVKSNGQQETSSPYFPRNSFGALIGVTGSGGSPMGGVGYTGAATPNATGGFVYLRNRWYDPQTGRFLTQDPIGLAGGVNLYAYAGNNPIAFVDPFGLECPENQKGNCTQSDVSGADIPHQETFWGGVGCTNHGVCDPYAEVGWAGAAGRLVGAFVGATRDMASGQHPIDGAVGAALSQSAYPTDFATKNTQNRGAMFGSEGEARNLARTKLGKNPVQVEENKWRSADGRWQYRAKPGDTSQNHVHLERLDPQTGEVLTNWHLYWK